MIHNKNGVYEVFKNKDLTQYKDFSIPQYHKQFVQVLMEKKER